MPPFNAVRGTMGIPNVARSLPVVRGFPYVVEWVTDQDFTISGTTLDSAGAAKAGATVYLFEMRTDGVPYLVATTVSDATGYYKFFTSVGTRYWIVDYKSGSPDLAGATVNTLVGV